MADLNATVPSANPGAPKKRFPIWLIVLLVAVPFVVGGLGIVSAMAVYGVRRYIENAKRGEATAMVAELSAGMVRCAQAGGGLPETSPAVPAALSEIRGKKYQSSASEWSAPAFTCAGFASPGPQYFQYQWVRTGASVGDVRASGDLDGDGTPEVQVSSRVDCSAGLPQCTCSAPAEGPAAVP